MKSREQITPPETETPKLGAWTSFGGSGHEGEYLVNLEDCDWNNYIPQNIPQKIQDILGDEWDVSNRGTRLEIMHKREYGKQNDELVYSAIKEALKDKYNLKIRS